jgi:CRP-like cAMP-binding protein
MIAVCDTLNAHHRNSGHDLGAACAPAQAAEHVIRKNAHNRLLKTLPDGLAAKLRPDFEKIEMKVQSVFARPGEPVSHVYFPLSGMISLVQHLHNGEMAEVGIIGNEGFLGVPALLGATSTPLEAMAQIAGQAWRMERDVFLRHVENEPQFRKVLSLFAQATTIQISQTAVCNARHTLPQRLGRWLLEARSRHGDDDLPLRHEFLAMMLGTRRAGVSLALGDLKKRGVVLTRRGIITIEDRDGLEAVACECHGSVQAAYERLLPAR